MPSITRHLSDLFGSAFAGLGLDPALGTVVASQRPELGQFQCNGALAAAKAAGRNPRELAEEVAAVVSGDPTVAAVSIAGPGFINVDVTDDHLAAVLGAKVGDDRLGLEMPAEPVRYVVDYGGPNVAKELHVGHLRPAIIGESVKRLIAFAGHEAIGDVHLGDWGTPMGQIIALLAERRPELPYFDPDQTGPFPAESPVTVDDLEELYPQASARAKEDAAFAEAARAATVALQDGRPGYRALWQHFRDVSVASMEAIYDDLDVHFELWYGESSVHDRIAPMIERIRAKGVIVESDGALIIDVAEPGDTKEIPPLLLVKRDGGYLYGTTDLATIEERVDDLGAGSLVYVVDARQSLHFEQVFRAARKAGIAPPGVTMEHDPFGTVNGPDGKPMRTRDGNLPRLRGLIDDAVTRAEQRLEENDLATGYDAAERAEIARAVGIAALKYGDLSNHRTSDYIFDLDRFVAFEGKTGPYMLYGAVRIRSILRNAVERGLATGTILPPTVDAERALMLRLTRFEDVIARALEFRAPNHLAEYSYEVATDFNRFYEVCHILNEPDPPRQASWLGLVDLTLATLRTLLDLLAIEAPERM
jgi:arginyl-tRNA synthetase